MRMSYLEAVRQENQHVNPLFSLLGARLDAAEEGRAVVSMPINPAIAQGGGLVAGGILATLADEAMAHAVLSTLPEGQGAVTVEMNIRYLRGASPEAGGRLTAEARVVRRGGTLCVAEARVSLGRGDDLALAGATFSLLRRR